MVGVADSDRTCCPVMVAERGRAQPTCGLACARSKHYLVIETGEGLFLETWTLYGWSGEHRRAIRLGTAVLFIRAME